MKAWTSDLLYLKCRYICSHFPSKAGSDGSLLTEIPAAVGATLGSSLDWLDPQIHHKPVSKSIVVPMRFWYFAQMGPTPLAPGIMFSEIEKPSAGCPKKFLIELPAPGFAESLQWMCCSAFPRANRWSIHCSNCSKPCSIKFPNLRYIISKSTRQFLTEPDNRACLGSKNGQCLWHAGKVWNCFFL